MSSELSSIMTYIAGVYYLSIRHTILSGLRRPMTTQSLPMCRRETVRRERKLGVRACASAPAISSSFRPTRRPKSVNFGDNSSEKTKILRLRPSVENKMKSSLASAS